MNHREPELEARPAIPDDNAPLPPARWPTRWTVRRGRAIAFLMLGLALAASLAALYLTYGKAADVDHRLEVLEQDLTDRTRQRDAERDAAAAQAQRDREQFRAHLCEVLTELSVTFPNLTDLRAALSCPTPPPGGDQVPGPGPSEGDPPGAQLPERPPAEPSATAPGPPPPAPPPKSSPAPPSPSETPADSRLVCGLLPVLC